ncbi:MAG: hypothetical protein COV75_05785 [Candidatus Omnitrophica bacterium CG11_big_fil_rev_8_21_14_0_20_63_9]|nr:MAG: hypothetical protein COV75_05785 [Candidatus Omnitrophica bacterium CG11_big_fil_rev_8_21_14_0_20_63_9]
MLLRVAEAFTAIGGAIDRHDDGAVGTLLQQAQDTCQRAAEQAVGETKAYLVNVGTALQTWQQVWPRLGEQPEFRQAVGREARLWAKRFTELAHRDG